MGVVGLLLVAAYLVLERNQQLILIILFDLTDRYPT